MPKPRVVLDTNVVVSAHLSESGFERFVLDLAFAGKLQLVVSEQILEEYSGVLLRAKFRLPAKQIRESMNLIRESAEVIRPGVRVDATKDPDDNKFLECAEAGQVDYVVTGNKKHFPKAWKNTRVVNAKELIVFITPDVQA